MKEEEKDGRSAEGVNKGEDGRRGECARGGEGVSRGEDGRRGEGVSRIEGVREDLNSIKGRLESSGKE